MPENLLGIGGAKQISSGAVLFLLVAGLGTYATAQGRKLNPVDEGTKDASFATFRDRLLEAARKHDTRFILSILDQEILNTLGGDGGVEEFKEHWKLDSPQSRLWETLTTILTLGGAFRTSPRGTAFCAPYVFTEWPRDLDEFTDGYEAVIAEGVPLRRRPRSNASVVARLSYDIVKVVDWIGNPRNRRAWAKVSVPGVGEGYVRARYLRSPISYRACFEKKYEKWVMTVLVAGE